MANPERVSSYRHLQMVRETPTNERHRNPSRQPRFRPEDPKDFGVRLSRSLNAARRRLTHDLGGYDDRRLLKVELREGEFPPNLEAIAGVEFVSQEERSVILAFATEEALAEVEARLTTLSRDGKVTRQDLLFAIEGFDRWSPADRKGKALREHGFPGTEKFILDVELWPVEWSKERTVMIERFDKWLVDSGIECLDSLRLPSLVMVKVRCTRRQAEDLLLQHRDIRLVDLPPRFGLEMGDVRADISKFPPPHPLSQTAPAVTVLDSGVTTGHPLIGVAVGEAQGFVSADRRPGDDIPGGHGTFVAGLALYGDVEEAIRRREFVPELHLLSGKVFTDDGTDQTEFVESAVEEAVRYFVDQYGCRVFNLSYGDLNRVYDGRRLRGLAYTLDRLTRELNVLFVTSAGNRTLASLPEDARGRYPDYLFEDDGRLLDPGTALNVITVGGLARYEASSGARRYPESLEDTPIARNNQPSPITRCGPSVGDAIKPDFVEYAGNVAVGRLGGHFIERGLGVVSLNSGFATEGAFRESIGTSYAAPVVANKAARLLAEFPDASSNLLRALLGVHARWPEASVELFSADNTAAGKEKLLRALGYGQVNEEALYRSLNDTVTLFAEDKIETNRHHFFEIPIPDTWWEGGRRRRSVSVALAYTPDVRTTRIDYRATRIWYSFVNANTLDEVSHAFKRNRQEGIQERGSNRSINQRARSSGTLQVSRWHFGSTITKKRLFVVVTRRDPAWNQNAEEPERYALCIKLEDREQVDVNLYAEVNAILQARAQAKAQVHVRV